jgi:hypothetical protein
MSDSPRPDCDPHFDRRDTLNRLLRTFPPRRVHSATRQEYLSWDVEHQKSYDQGRLAAISLGNFVETETVAELRSVVRRAVTQTTRTTKHSVLLSGPGGVGKTTAALSCLAQALTRHDHAYPEWDRLGHTPVVYVEIPAAATARAVMGRFLHFLGMPLLARATSEERIELVAHHLRDARTSIVVIDEFQHLELATPGHLESVQALDTLFSQVPAVPLLVGTTVDDARPPSAAPHTVEIVMRRFPYLSDEDRERWSRLFLDLEGELGLLDRPPARSFRHYEYVWQRTSGCIGALARLLQTSALLLISAAEPSRERITRRLLESVKLDLASEDAWAEAKRAGHA